MIAPIPYDEALALVQRLSLSDQLRLVSALTNAAARALDHNDSAPPVEVDGWTRWAQLRADLSARPAGATSMAAQLAHDREARQATLEGRDVYP